MFSNKNNYTSEVNLLIHRINNGATPLWYLGIIISALAICFGAWGTYNTLVNGLGTWGLNNTVGWGFGITNFVWWVGIGHAGTFISAVLLIFNQKWRSGINRAAEGMTIFAILCAGFFPIIHMGRPLLFFFAFPYPNTRDLWVNFNSPLLWDVFAISTYLIVSIIFWYVNLIPDLSLLAQESTRPMARRIYKFFSLGWVGTTFDWLRLEKISRWMAGLAAPLVISVHTIVSFDFATSILPGWHSTIFPPYFVAGALYSGFAMVLTLLIIARKTMNLHAFIEIHHIEKMTRILLITGCLVGVAYFLEIFGAYYSGNLEEIEIIKYRMFGPKAYAFWIMIACNLLLPHLFWFKKNRMNIPLIFILSILINIGMWFERYVIVVSSLEHDFLPANWSIYKPTLTEFALFIGSLGLFFFLFMLFIRTLPIVSIWENFTKTKNINHHENSKIYR